MTKMVLAAALVAAAFTPLASFADDAAGHAMAPDAMATMVCRSARAGEKPSVMMMGAQPSALVCKSVADVMKARKMGPDTSKALSTQQADEAWQRWIAETLAIPVTPP